MTEWDKEMCKCECVCGCLSVWITVDDKCNNWLGSFLASLSREVEEKNGKLYWKDGPFLLKINTPEWTFFFSVVTFIYFLYFVFPSFSPDRCGSTGEIVCISFVCVWMTEWMNEMRCVWIWMWVRLKVGRESVFPLISFRFPSVPEWEVCCCEVRLTWVVERRLNSRENEVEVVDLSKGRVTLSEDSDRLPAFSSSQVPAPG